MRNDIISKKKYMRNDMAMIFGVWHVPCPASFNQDGKFARNAGTYRHLSFMISSPPFYKLTHLIYIYALIYSHIINLSTPSLYINLSHPPLFILFSVTFFFFFGSKERERERAKNRNSNGRYICWGVQRFKKVLEEERLREAKRVGS